MMPSVICLPHSEEGIPQKMNMRMQHLETLGITCTLTPHTLKTICSCRNLKHLLVANEHLVTSTAINMYPLTALNNLQSLQLQCIHKSISNSHTTKEVTQFARLVKLEVVGGRGALSRLIFLSTNLRNFNLQERHYADENLINISSCKSLIHLNISPHSYFTENILNM